MTMPTLDSARTFFEPSGGLAVALGLLVGLCLAAPVHAAESGASAWSKGLHSKARLIDGGRQGDALLVGVEVEMDDGWKTYWRTPGDSGLPPFFDWQGSGNLKQARVQWPAPRRLTDASGTYAGYKHTVVFPVLIEPAKRGAPVALRLDLQYAVCADICVPAEAKLALDVAGQGGAGQQTVARALARVPVRLSKPDGVSPAVKAVKSEFAGAEPHLIVEAVFPRGAEGADLLVEGPEGTYVPPSKPLGPAGANSIRYRVDLGGPKDLADLKGKDLVFTVLSDAGQSETVWRVP